jgi:hypothetical protein
MKRLPNFLLMMLTTVLLATFITSCSESGSDSDPSTTPTQPQTPVSDGDWQVVPVTGGTIEKGDISITFPSGTFSKDTKVAVTEVKKGQTVGSDYEASAFYQITMPITTHKPMTICIKSAKQNDDMQFIIRAKSYARSASITEYHNTYIDTKYSNGEYSATLPVFDNDDETINDDFTIGLVHIPTAGNARTRGDHVVMEGKVKDLKWKLYFDPKCYGIEGTYKFLYIPEYIDPIVRRINDAITQILNLGYEIKDKNRVIPYYFKSSPNNWGTFNQDWRSDSRSWITLSMEKFINEFDDSASIKMTIIHETFHYFQADYDPRCAYRKAGGFGGYSIDNENILYEMGAVWIEQFVNKGQLNASFLQGEALQYVFYDKNNTYGDKLGIENEAERWASEGDKDKIFQRQGYTLAPLLYYLTTQYVDGFNNDNKVVLELHQLWNKKWKSDTYNAYYIIEDWVKSKGSEILKYSAIDNYYLDFFKGDLVKDFSIANLIANSHLHIQKDVKSEFTGNLHPYGCAVRKVSMKGFENVPVEKKELVIKHLDDKAHTYVIYTDKTSNYRTFKYLENNGERWRAGGGDSIVIKGNELEKLRLVDGTFNHAFYLITTNNDNEMHTTTKKPFKLSIELRDQEQKSASVSPTELTFPAEGGTQTATVSSKGYSRYNHKISDKYKEWLSAKNNPAGKMDITVQPNTTGKERIGYVRVYVFNDENPTEAQKVYLKDSIKVTQAANKEPEQQESEYELVSGSVNMYYAVVWRWEKSFKLGDDGVTITPNGKGAKVVINQEGTDLTFTWHSTISFEIDDLSLNESNQARISHFRFELEKDVIPYQYYDFHIDSGHELIRMVSPAPKSSYIGGLWTYSKDDLSYYSKSTIHYDKWRKDYYSAYVEHTEESETSEVTDGSSISIGLYINKKK